MTLLWDRLPMSIMIMSYIWFNLHVIVVILPNSSPIGSYAFISDFSRYCKRSYSALYDSNDRTLGDCQPFGSVLGAGFP